MTETDERLKELLEKTQEDTRKAVVQELTDKSNHTDDKPDEEIFHRQEPDRSNNSDYGYFRVNIDYDTDKQLALTLEKMAEEATDENDKVELTKLATNFERSQCIREYLW
jgi:hypothetical protein